MSEYADQKARLIEAMNRGEKIDEASALMLYGVCGGLRSRMSELIKAGVPIEKEWVPNKGRGKHLRYYIKEENRK